MQTIKILVAAHKKFRMPEDDIYLPIQVGAEGKTDSKGNPLDFGYVKDNTGDNISGRNAEYSELTGIYWAWKNLDADVTGLVHYRRYFRGSQRTASKDPFDRILTGAELRKLLNRYEIIVPKKRRYYIETLYSHYVHTHFPEELDETRKVIASFCPKYLGTYDRVMKRTWGYMFNMMILPKEQLNAYCSWLFPILFRLSDRLDGRELTPFEARYPGRISELLFNVWLQYQTDTGKIRPERIKELPFLYMEKINKTEKVAAFLKAKFFHQKQSRSF